MASPWHDACCMTADVALWKAGLATEVDRLIVLFWCVAVYLVLSCHLNHNSLFFHFMMKCIYIYLKEPSNTNCCHLNHNSPVWKHFIKRYVYNVFERAVYPELPCLRTIIFTGTFLMRRHVSITTPITIEANIISCLFLFEFVLHNLCIQIEVQMRDIHIYTYMNIFIFCYNTQFHVW